MPIEDIPADIRGLTVCRFMHRQVNRKDPARRKKAETTLGRVLRDVEDPTRDKVPNDRIAVWEPHAANQRLVGFDIDRYPDPLPDSVLDGLVCAWRSPSGTGWHAIAALDRRIPADRYLAAWKGVAAALRLPELVAGRVFPGMDKPADYTDRHDAGGVFHLTAQGHVTVGGCRLHTIDPPPAAAAKPETPAPARTRGGQTLKRGLALLDRLPPIDDYLRWKTVLIAFAREYGDHDTIRRAAQKWSAGSPRYNPDEWPGHWAAALNAGPPAHGDPVTLATVALWANEATSEPTPAPPPTPTALELGDITGIDPWGHVTAPFGLDRPPPPAADPIVDGIAYRGEAIYVYGDPKVGKSTLACAICAAAPRALYIAHERVGQSYAALAAAIGHEPGTPRTHLHAPAHLRPADLLIEWAAAAPTVVIIDSYTSARGDTHTGTNAMDWWTEHVTPWTHVGCAVVVLSHQAKADGGSPLGSVTQQALADAAGEVTNRPRAGGGSISATW
ncbi:MAG: AAA family ATPase, partial [Gammaproteobacteria bacterium]|nr:AAA family ATPase [Gammaproteobacteria bacterium]